MIEGTYEIMASPTDTISFSYLGYKPKEILIGNQKEMKIKLESNIELDEIVINAYGVRKKTFCNGWAAM